MNAFREGGRLRPCRWPAPSPGRSPLKNASCRTSTPPRSGHPPGGRPSRKVRWIPVQRCAVSASVQNAPDQPQAGVQLVDLAVGFDPQDALANAPAAEQPRLAASRSACRSSPPASTLPNVRRTNAEELASAGLLKQSVCPCCRRRRDRRSWPCRVRVEAPPPRARGPGGVAARSVARPRRRMIHRPVGPQARPVGAGVGPAPQHRVEVGPLPPDRHGRDWEPRQSPGRLAPARTQRFHGAAFSGRLHIACRARRVGLPSTSGFTTTLDADLARPHRDLPVLRFNSGTDSSEYQLACGSQ